MPLFRHASSLYNYDSALWIAAGNHQGSGGLVPDVWKLTMDFSGTIVAKDQEKKARYP